MTDDPERLVAEALRAHAARTPLPETRATRHEPADEETGRRFGGYGLLSGSDVTLPNPDPVTVREPVAATRRIEPPEDAEDQGGIAAGWIILLAVTLGLAVGAVVGLVTLL